MLGAGWEWPLDWPKCCWFVWLNYAHFRGHFTHEKTVETIILSLTGQFNGILVSETATTRPRYASLNQCCIWSHVLYTWASVSRVASEMPIHCSIHKSFLGFKQSGFLVAVLVRVAQHHTRTHVLPCEKNNRPSLDQYWTSTGPSAHQSGYGCYTSNLVMWPLSARSLLNCQRFNVTFVTWQHVIRAKYLWVTSPYSQLCRHRRHQWWRNDAASDRACVSCGHNMKSALMSTQGEGVGVWVV